jgi:hypothetical protein
MMESDLSSKICVIFSALDQTLETRAEIMPQLSRKVSDTIFVSNSISRLSTLEIPISQLYLLKLRYVPGPYKVSRRSRVRAMNIETGPSDPPNYPPLR